MKRSVRARNNRKPSVGGDGIGLGGRIERAEERPAIGKRADGKSMPRQLATDNLAVVLVVFDEKYPNGIRFAPLVRRVRWFENWEASAREVATGEGGSRRPCSHPLYHKAPSVPISGRRTANLPRGRLARWGGWGDLRKSPVPSSSSRPTRPRS